MCVCVHACACKGGGGGGVGGIGKWSDLCGRMEGGTKGTGVLSFTMECQKLAIENNNNLSTLMMMNMFILYMIPPLGGGLVERYDLC